MKKSPTERKNFQWNLNNVIEGIVISQKELN